MRATLPVWLKGMTNLTFGISGGLIAITLPQVCLLYTSRCV